jgi:hypothetical protein
MAENINLEVLSTRSGFNSAVRHINKTMDIASEAGSGNFGDIIYELEDEELTSSKVGLLLRMLLVDKLGYKSASANLSAVVGDLDGLSKEFAKWSGVDLVAAYYHPEMGLLVANPKIAEELAAFGELRKPELLVVYAGLQGKETDENCQKAADLALNMFEGAKAAAPAALTKGKFTVKKVTKPSAVEETKTVKTKTAKAAKPDAKKAPAKKTPAVQAPAGPAKMTPR